MSLSSQAERPAVLDSRASTHYPEGTWESPGYRSAATRAKVALAFFAVAAVAAALEAVMALQGINLMGQAANGTASPDDFAALAETADAIDGFYLLSVIALAIAFLAWLSRTVDNTPALGAGIPKDSPRWAIGWWFIPIANLWKPYGVVRELWNRLATPTRSTDGNLVLAWWLAWVGSAFVGRFAQYSLRGAATIEALEGMFWLLLVTDLGVIAAAILGFLVVREIQARADRRAQELGFEVPLPHAHSTVRAADWTAASPTVSEPPVAQPSPGQFCSSCGTRRIPATEFCSSCGRRHLPVG